MTSDPQDSADRPLAAGDHVSWRGQIYTIKSFGPHVGRNGTRAVFFEEPLHIKGDVPDEIAVNLVCDLPAMTLPPCDLEWGHPGRMHANCGDGFFVNGALEAEHVRRQLAKGPR